MRSQRMILGIRWHDFVRNTEVVDLTNLPCVQDVIAKRRNSLFGIQGSSSWPLWVDGTDLCCLRDLMMMMISGYQLTSFRQLFRITRRFVPSGSRDSRLNL